VGCPPARAGGQRRTRSVDGEGALTSGARLPAKRSPAAIVGGVKARDLEASGRSAAGRRRETGGGCTPASPAAPGRACGESLFGGGRPLARRSRGSSRPARTHLVERTRPEGVLRDHSYGAPLPQPPPIFARRAAAERRFWGWSPAGARSAAGRVGGTPSPIGCRAPSRNMDRNRSLTSLPHPLLPDPGYRPERAAAIAAISR
jgi:hypothetical protein